MRCFWRSFPRIYNIYCFTQLLLSTLLKLFSPKHTHITYIQQASKQPFILLSTLRAFIFLFWLSSLSLSSPHKAVEYNCCSLLGHQTKVTSQFQGFGGSDLLFPKQRVLSLLIPVLLACFRDGTYMVLNIISAHSAYLSKMAIKQLL